MASLRATFTSGRCFRFRIGEGLRLHPQPLRVPHGTVNHLQRYRPYTSAPRIAQPSFWRSLIPKPWRSENSAKPPSSTSPRRQDTHNPFLIYAIIFLFVGSNAVNQIGIRNQLTEFTRKTDAQLALLREVIRKVHAGEEVDVEALLGTGDSKREKDWEEVLKEVEGIDELWDNQKRKAAEKVADAQAKKDDTVQVAQARDGVSQLNEASSEAPKKRFGFY